MHWLLHAVTAILFLKPALAFSTGVNYIAKFDNIKGNNISSYMGLTYANFEVVKAQPNVNPSSPPNMIHATDLFGMEISVNPTNDYYYGTINSFNMACLSCFGSECLAGMYAAPCNITVVAYVDGFPQTQTRNAILQYNPPPFKNNTPPAASTVMKKVIPQNFNGDLSGTFFRLFFTSGVIGTNVYFDNINYRFGA